MQDHVVSMPLDGRIALVTGAASGIGRATALRLAMDGAAMVGCLDLDLDGARRVVDEIEAAGRPATAIGADVTDPAVVGDQLTAFAADHGHVEILVNNAGIPGGGRFVDVSFEDWQRVLDVHVSGAFHLTKAVLPGMIERGWGRVVNVASESVWLGNQSVQYVTAKAALIGFTRALAYQVGPDGVLVNAVAPGPVDTPMLRSGTPAEIDAELAATRIGRLLRPDEIAASVAFLVGPGGDVFVGQVLSPNGGTVFGG
jgi:NAD(P)-dependent dehydrogenase (short-subunit alcohol dehydrogenase family)